jgi:threonine aldolase
VELCEALYRRGIWAQDTATYSVRLVTHVDVNREGIERALVVLGELGGDASAVKAAASRRTP